MASSQAKIEANRRNAQQSTGPNTPAGKDRSRLNALKHGLCAKVVAIPGEDPTVARERAETWAADLNPGGFPFDGYLVEILARESVRLDRCHKATEARLAERVRNAGKGWDDRRMLDVEALTLEMLEGKAPHTAARRLKASPQGCDYLIQELEQLLQPMVTDPPLWDLTDSIRLYTLLGMLAPAKGKSPDPTGLCAWAIREFREVAARLKENERPDVRDFKFLYASQADHEYDLARLPGLRAKGIAARDEIIWIIRKEVQALKDLRASMVDADDLDRAEAPLRVLFDDSREGQLIQRYEFEASRNIQRTVNTLKSARIEREARGNNESHVSTSKRLADSAKIPPTTPPAANPPRNEARRTDHPARNRAVLTLADPPSNFVDIAITPPRRPNDRK